MTTTPNAPRPILDQEAIWSHVRTALDARTPIAIWTALADVPVLLAEVERLGRLLTWARFDFANLLAAARATLAADHDGETDPLYYLRDEVAAQQAAPSSTTDDR
jgi:hypothetical protein